MSLIRVDKNVPMPDKGTGRDRNKYPWLQLGVSVGSPLRGDSFLVACSSSEMRKVWDSLSSCKRHIQQRHNRKFTCRIVPDGIRVWRIS